MKTIKIGKDKPGWITIPFDTKIVVAYFNDGSRKEYALLDFLTLKAREKNNIMQIDIIRRKNYEKDGL